VSTYQEQQEEEQQAIDSQSLLEGLETFEASQYVWSFALYGFTKSRDGKVMEFTKTQLEGCGDWAQDIAAYMAEKQAKDRPVFLYDAKHPKEVIGALKKEDPRIGPVLTDITLSIENGDAWDATDLEFAETKWAGYAIYGKAEDGRQAIFMRRSNPLQPGNNYRLFVTEGAGLSRFGDTALKCGLTCDFLLLEGVCYFLTESVAKDFELESREKAAAIAALKTIEEAGFVGDISRFQEVAFKPKNMKKFLDFDEAVMNHIQKMPIEDRADYLSHYMIDLDKSGSLGCFDDAMCESIIDLITSRSCLDALGRVVYGRFSVRED